LNNFYLKRRLTPMGAALLGNFIYLVLCVIMQQILKPSNMAGNDYNVIIGVIELVVGVGFWIGFYYFTFRQHISAHGSPYWQYIFFSVLPIFLITLAGIILLYLFPVNDFSSIWNEFSFLMAPMIFYYIPFGLLFKIVGTSIPFGLFLGICLVLMMLAQVLGIALGGNNRKQLEAKLEKEAQKAALAHQQMLEKVEKEKLMQAETRLKNETRRAKSSRDPFADDRDDTQVIYTEAFSVITDEMMQQAQQQKPKKETAENTFQKASQATDIFTKVSQKQPAPVASENEAEKPRVKSPEIQKPVAWETPTVDRKKQAAEREEQPVAWENPAVSVRKNQAEKAAEKQPAVTKTQKDTPDDKSSEATDKGEQA